METFLVALLLVVQLILEMDFFMQMLNRLELVILEQKMHKEILEDNGLDLLTEVDH